MAIVVAIGSKSGRITISCSIVISSRSVISSLGSVILIEYSNSRSCSYSCSSNIVL